MLFLVRVALLLSRHRLEKLDLEQNNIRGLRTVESPSRLSDEDLAWRKQQAYRATLSPSKLAELDGVVSRANRAVVEMLERDGEYDVDEDGW